MINAMNKYFHKYAIHKTRNVLIGMTDRQLEDVGISRTLLMGGVQNWPWRAETDSTDSNTVNQVVDQPKKAKSADVSKAIRELSDMSDSQLRDIGIDRGSIRHAAIHGLPDREQRSVA